MQKKLKSQKRVKYNSIEWPEDFPYKIYKHSPIGKDVNWLHFHTGLEIGICYKGSGLLSIYNTVIPFTEGDVNIVLPGHPHAVINSKNDESFWHFLIVDVEKLYSDMIVTEFKPIADMMYVRKDTPNLIRRGNNVDVTDLVKAIFYEFEHQEECFKITIKALLWAFLLKITRLTPDNTIDRRIFYESENNYSIITPAINYINSNYDRNVTVQELADMCFLSKAQFNLIFKKVMRYTPLSFVKYVRIRMASMHLRTSNTPISEIAYGVGYQSISSFNRDFLESKQISPRQYRNKFC